MNTKKISKTLIFQIILATLLIINMVFTGIIFGTQLKSNEQNKSDAIKYTLYIGTNDKDTYQEEIEFNDCLVIVTNICTKYTSGCTVYEANGYWKDDTNTITKERTIACILEDIELDSVYKICDEIIISLNQNSILIETSTVTTTFYSTQN